MLRCPSGASSTTTAPGPRAHRGDHAALDGAEAAVARHRRLAARRRALAAARLLEALAAHGEAINPEAHLVAENIRDVAFNIPFLQGDGVRRGDELQLRLRPTSSSSASARASREPFRCAAARIARGLPGLRGAGDAEPVRQPRHRALGMPSTATGSTTAPSTNLPVATRARRCWRAAPPRAALQRRVLFQMTHLGAPMVYYGDEAGAGASDPCCRGCRSGPELALRGRGGRSAGGPRPRRSRWPSTRALRPLSPLHRVAPCPRLVLHGHGGSAASDDARHGLLVRRRATTRCRPVAIAAAKQRSGSCWRRHPGWRDRWNGGQA